MTMPPAIAGAAVLALLVSLARAQDPAANNEDGLSQELEAAFREFSKEAADSRRDQATKAVEKRADALARELKLDPAAKARLAEHYPRLVEATQAAWQDRFQEWLRPILARSADQTGTLEGWDAESMARNPSEVWARPDRTEAWREALEEVLNEVQMARYQADEKERTRKARQQIQEFLEAGDHWVRNSLAPILDSEITQLQRLSALEEERIKRLKAAAESVMGAIVEAWSRKAEALMLEMDDEMRAQRIRNRRFVRLDPSAPESAPKEHRIWREALAEVLTEEERKTIERLRNEFRDRRTQALAMVLVETLDPFLGLTRDQRSRMQALFAPPLLDLPGHYFVPPRPEAYYSVSPEQLFGKVSELEEEQLRAVLDDTKGR